ncbi:SH3 domain-containing protein [Arthrobacter sp.]|uniref:SH3 domain-containing protein n=1 Tax=Arthrobacter sp. TaxID=1667 RepID=UPI003A8DDDEA
MNKTKKLLWSTLSAAALIAGTIGAGPVYAAPAKDTVVSPLKPNTYRFSSTQGPRCIPVRNGTTMHLGQDLAASNGSPIYAVADGVVTATHNGVYQGTAGYIVVRHVLGGQTYYTAYIHMYNAGKYVRVGQKVKAGQRIADVGSSGASTAPHLHFEVWGSAGWMKGPTIEPMAWLKRYGVDMKRHATVVYNFTLPKSCNYWAASDLNLRSSASTASKLVKVVRKGTPMTSVPGAYANGYVKVNAAGVNGWAVHGAVSPTRVAADPAKIEVTPVAANLYYYATANVNLRQGPSTAYNTLGTVPSGTRVKVTGTSGRWLRLVYGSKTGFASADYFTRTAPAPVKAPAKTPVKTPAKPAPKPTTPAKKTTLQVKSNVNLRKGASTKDAVIMVLPKAAKVVQTSASGGWSKVTYQGKTGYVASSYLVTPPKAPAKPAPKPVVKAPAKAPAKKTTKQTTANLSLRAGASTSKKRVLVIPKNARVTVTSTSKGWSKVTYKGKTGYVSASYLKNVAAAKPAAKKPVVKKAAAKTPAKKAPAKKAVKKAVKKTTKQTTANLSLRAGASTSKKRVLVIPKSAKVTVTSTSRGWSKVTYKGKTGYVSASYLKNVAAAKPAAKKPVVKKAAAKAPAKKAVKKTTRKATANLSLRAGASTSKKRLAVITKNAKVTVTSTSKGWSKVTYKGKTGYASARYLK